MIDEETRLAKAMASEELARWLREAGHRKRLMGTSLVVDPPGMCMPTRPETRPRFNSIPSARLSVVALLAVSYLQYFYADVLLQVYSIHSLIVFVLVNGRIA